jgi:hypothetical protein
MKTDMKTEKTNSEFIEIFVEYHQLHEFRHDGSNIVIPRDHLVHFCKRFQNLIVALDDANRRADLNEWIVKKLAELDRKPTK